MFRPVIQAGTSRVGWRQTGRKEINLEASPGGESLNQNVGYKERDRLESRCGARIDKTWQLIRY